MESLWQDLRYSVRVLRQNPLFTAVAVVALALGIGANTAIFSVVNATLIRPLPFKDPGRLVMLWGNVMRAHLERRGTSLPDFLDWRAQSRSFEGMAVWWDQVLTVFGSDEPERVNGEYVSAGYFDLLGVRPVLGRSFRAGEDVQPGAAPVAVLGYGFWARHFGADPAVIGGSIKLNQRTYTIVGVMPVAFKGLSDAAEVWMPVSAHPGVKELLAGRGDRGPEVIARLKRGVSSQQAQAEMDSVCKALERAYPVTNEKRGVEIASLAAETFGDIRPALLVIMAAVGFVLLIACANVANLLLAKTTARQREMAVRAAIGASRGRLFRQLITESLVLAVAGAVLGGLVSVWGVAALMAFSPVTFPSFVRPRIDLAVALFTLGLSLATGVAVGLAPAIRASGGRLHDGLKDASGWASSGIGRRRFTGALVAADVALVLVLLIGAGLLIRAFQRLSRVDPGFRPDHLLSLRVSLPVPEGQASPDPAGARVAAERVAALPGVQQVALGSDIPLSGDASAIFYTAEGQPPVTAQNIPRAYVHEVTPGFFAALGIPILRGRDFRGGEQGVVVVSENVVRRFWPDSDPIGRRIKAGRPTSKEPWSTIVGVVGEVKYRGLPDNPTADPDLYAPFEGSTRFTLFARTAGDPASLAGALRAELRAINRSTVVFDAAPMLERVAGQLARSRFASWITGILSGVALLLAVVGIYGVMAQMVAHRTREIGIRMALGASGADVLRMVLRRGILLAAMGAGAGLALALILTPWLRSLLFGVTATDPLTYIGVTSLLVAVALAAMYIPARRASRTDPIQALRYQ